MLNIEQSDFVNSKNEGGPLVIVSILPFDPVHLSFHCLYGSLPTEAQWRSGQVQWYVRWDGEGGLLHDDHEDLVSFSPRVHLPVDFFVGFFIEFDSMSVVFCLTGHVSPVSCILHVLGCS